MDVSLVASADPSGNIGLFLDALLVFLVGLLTWMTKNAIQDWNTRGERLDYLERMTIGGEDEEGLVDIVEMHDSELDRTERHRMLLQRRLRVAEERIQRIVDDAEIRNGLAEIQEDLQDQSPTDFDPYEAETSEE